MRVIIGAMLMAFVLVLPPAALRAEGERAGNFDYYVMALSWSPNWCAREGDARDEAECRAGAARSFTLHGLWPQFEEGWPSYCRTGERDPTRAESAAMADLMGSGGLAWYQWKKHGRCAGLAPQSYYATLRRAFATVQIPPVLQGLNRRLELPASVVEDAFLEVNPQLAADQITVTCDADMIQEVRICLTRDLQPRRCGPDVIRDCRLKDAVLTPVR